MTDLRSERAGPHWRRIASVIEAELAEGRYPGDRPLPTVLDFAERFSVNRHTVRQALASLQARGLISLERGRGTFVVERAIDYRIGRRVRLRSNLAGIGVEGAGEFLSSEIIPADVADAEALGLEPGAALWRILTRSWAGRHVLNVGVHLLSADRFPDFVERYKAGGVSTTAAFASYGFGDYIRLSTRIEARAPDPDEMDRLGLPPGVPVIITDGLDGTPQGAPLQRITTAFAAHRVRLVVEPEGGEAAAEYEAPRE